MTDKTPPQPPPEQPKPGNFDAIVSRDDVLPVERERVNRSEENKGP